MKNNENKEVNNTEEIPEITNTTAIPLNDDKKPEVKLEENKDTVEEKLEVIGDDSGCCCILL